MTAQRGRRRPARSIFEEKQRRRSDRQLSKVMCDEQPVSGSTLIVVVSESRRQLPTVNLSPDIRVLVGSEAEYEYGQYRPDTHTHTHISTIDSYRRTWLQTVS